MPPISFFFTKRSKVYVQSIRVFFFSQKFDVRIKCCEKVIMLSHHFHPMKRHYRVLFFKIKFSVSFEESSPQRCKFEISVKTVQPFGCMKQFCLLPLPTSYCVSLIMVTITRHIFINIFQAECFSAVKFVMGYEKNMVFLLIKKA